MNNNLSDNLKKIRKDNNMSQEQLAEELKVSRQAISKWESGIAYPEMDKILQICALFELNINDLLNNDIREVKKEEESKNNINKYIDDFLKFITNTINMFSTMNFKSKFKCIFEQLIIVGIFSLIASILGSVFGSLFNDIFFNGLSYNVYQVLYGIFKSIYLLFVTIIIVIVIIHIFKTRYLDYYNSIKVNSINSEEPSKEVKEKIEISKNNDERIIIRDPRHSEYKFINGLLKFIVGCIKGFVFFLFMFFAFILIGLITLFICTFLISKTGILFIGLLISILSASTIIIIFEFIFLNFIFNRKIDKKKIIWSFIISIVTTGIGIGMIFLGTLNFKIISYDESNLLKIEYKEIEMQENLILNNYTNSVEFIEEDIDNIRIEYPINKYNKIKYEMYDELGYKELAIYEIETMSFEMIKEYLGYLNEKTIVNLDNRIADIKVYASKENISKLNNNYQSFILHQETAADY